MGDAMEQGNGKRNCWDFHKCGRQTGGSKVGELGVCPAAIDVSANGTNGGKNAGRVCWAVSGTLCGGKVQGTHAQKSATCMACEVYRTVRREEGAGFMIMKSGQKYRPHT